MILNGGWEHLTEQGSHHYRPTIYIGINMDESPKRRDSDFRELRERQNPIENWSVLL